MIGWVNSAMEHRILSSDRIDFLKARRLRIRVLVPPGTDIADAQTRELAERLAAQAGDHDAIAVMFYDGLLLDAGGTLWRLALRSRRRLGERCRRSREAQGLASDEGAMTHCFAVNSPDYWDATYRRELSEGRTRRHEHVWRALLNHIPSKGLAADIGCGTGEFLKLARERGWDASGVELSLEAVERANRLGLSVYLGMLPDQGETDMSFPDRFFDIVTLWNVLDVLPRPVDQIREIHRVLAPGGRIFIRTPNQHFHLVAYRLSRLFRWPQALAKLLQDSYIFHPLLWSPRSLRLILRHEGFGDINIWNSPLSLGDPYLVVPEERERLMLMIKKLVYDAAQAVYLGSGKKWLLGSSLSVLGKKPGGGWSVNREA